MVTLEDVKAGLEICLDILGERKGFCYTHSCDGCPIKEMGVGDCILNDAEYQIRMAHMSLMKAPVKVETKYQLKIGKNWASKKKFPSRNAAEKALPWLSYIMSTPVDEIKIVPCED